MVEQVAGGFPVETHFEGTVFAASLAHQVFVVWNVKMVKDHRDFALGHGPLCFSLSLCCGAVLEHVFC